MLFGERGRQGLAGMAVTGGGLYGLVSPFYLILDSCTSSWDLSSQPPALGTLPAARCHAFLPQWTLISLEP